MYILVSCLGVAVASLHGHFMQMPPPRRYSDLRRAPNAAALTRKASLVADVNASRRLFALALRASPSLGLGHSAALNNAGVAAWRSGDVEEAREMLNAALDAERENRLARLNLQLLADETRASAAAAAGGEAGEWCRDDARALAFMGTHASCEGARAAGACDRDRSRLRSVCRRTCALCGAGLYDRLPRGWRDRRLGAPLDLGDRCDLDVRSVQGSNAITAAEFAETYVRGRRPVLIRGLADLGKSWPSQCWSTSSSWSRSSTTNRTRFTNCSLHRASDFTLDTLALCNLEEMNAYINLDRDPRDATIRAELLAAYGDNEWLTGLDLLNESCYADLPSRWLLVSGIGTGSNWHVDPLNTSAWNTLVSGSKRWALYPSEVGVPLGLDDDDDEFDEGAGGSKKSAEEDDETKAGAAGKSKISSARRYFPFGQSGSGGGAGPEAGASRRTSLRAAARGQGWWGITAPHRVEKIKPLHYFSTTLPTLAPDERPLECMQRAGDTIFVPSGWWHTVLNTDASNVAFTHNFGAPGNVDEIAQELAKRPEGSAPRACLAALRRDGHVVAATSATTAAAAKNSSCSSNVAAISSDGAQLLALPVEFNRAAEAAIVGGNAQFHILVFAGTGGNGEEDEDASLVADAGAAASLLGDACTVVLVRSAYAEMRTLFEVVGAAAAVRIAEIGSILFVYKPPRDVELKAWVADVAAGHASPSLSASDRKSLLAMYRAQ